MSEPETVDFYFICVGTGDTILLNWGENKQFAAVIDCRKALPLINFFRKNPQIQSLDFCVVTHAHADHYSGYADLLDYCIENDLRIDSFLTTFVYNPTFLQAATRKLGYGDKKKLRELIQKIKGLCLSEENPDGLIGKREHVNSNFNTELAEQVQIRALAPEQQDYERYLEKSANGENAVCAAFMIANLRTGQYVLLTSDLEEPIFRRLDRQRFDQPKTSANEKLELVCGQIPHHGSEKNFVKTFWKKRKREQGVPAVISVGNSDRYGHPSPNVLDELKAMGYRLERTCERKPPLPQTLPDKSGAILNALIPMFGNIRPDDFLFRLAV